MWLVSTSNGTSVLNKLEYTILFCSTNNISSLTWKKLVNKFKPNKKVKFLFEKLKLSTHTLRDMIELSNVSFGCLFRNACDVVNL